MFSLKWLPDVPRARGVVQADQLQGWSWAS
jgi:hypothetical protein